MEIRKGTLDDLKEIESLSSEFDFETNRDWKDLISSGFSWMYVMWHEDRIIGFTGLIRYDWNNTLQISNVFVHPDFRGKGIAMKLIQHDIDEAKKTGFRCLIAEAPSLNPVKKLYERMGFRKCGYNDRYYSNHGEEICIWMSLDMK